MQAIQQTEFIARGLILHRSHALMCRNTKADFFYLPGGHIEFAEPASDALKRELLEETGTDITVGPLMLTTESAFHDGQDAHHELNLVFHVEQIGSRSLSTDQHPEPPGVVSREQGIDFAWVDLAAISTLDVRPPQIKAWLAAGGAVDNPPVQSQIGHRSSAAQSVAYAPHLTSFENTQPSI